MRTLDLRALMERVCDDPWSLNPSERSALLAACQSEQDRFLPLLRRVLEPNNGAPQGAAGTGIPEHFPAFLLAHGSFAPLGDALTARSDGRPETGVLDQLERFVELFSSWSGGGTPTRPTGPAAGEPFDPELG